MTLQYIPVQSKYFKPNEGYHNLTDNILRICEEGDIVFISETPISTLEGNLVDESLYDYGIVSFLITELWCKILWGYILGPLLHISKRSIDNIRQMPPEARNHKEFIYREFGLKYALQPTAEAGVDLSNVPGSYVSLLPENPERSAELIKRIIHEKSGKEVDIVIIDTDPTYKFRDTYFTTLPISIKGIVNDTGVYGYILRSFSEKLGATIIASTVNMELDELINIADSCEECQIQYNNNFFETVYNMKESFGSDFSEISVEMLSSIEHIPAVIVRQG